MDQRFMTCSQGETGPLTSGSDSLALESLFAFGARYIIIDGRDLAGCACNIYWLSPPTRHNSVGVCQLYHEIFIKNIQLSNHYYIMLPPMYLFIELSGEMPYREFCYHSISGSLQ